MRVYVHLEEEPAFTLIVTLSNDQLKDLTFRSILLSFVEAYNKAKGTLRTLNADLFSLEISTEDGRTAVNDSVVVGKKLKEKDDLFLVPRKSKEPLVADIPHSIVSAEHELDRDLSSVLPTSTRANNFLIIKSTEDERQIPTDKKITIIVYDNCCFPSPPTKIELIASKDDTRSLEKGEELSIKDTKTVTELFDTTRKVIIGLKKSPEAGEDMNAIRAKMKESIQKEAHTNAEVYRKEGNKLLAEGNTNGAIEKYTKAIELDSNVAIYYSNRAEAFIRKESWAEAIEDAKTSLEIDEKTPRSWFRLGRAAFALGQYARAKEAFIMASSFLQPSDHKGQLAYQQWIKVCDLSTEPANTSQNTKVLDLGPQKAVPASPSPTWDPTLDSWILTSQINAVELMKKGKFKNALAIYEQILTLKPGDKVSLFQIGNIWANAGKYDKALGYLETGVKRYEKDEEVDFVEKIAEVYMLAKKYSNAVTYYSKYGAKSNLTNEERLNNKVKLATAMYFKGDKDLGIQIAQNILFNESPNHPDALILYGIACMDRNMYEDAMRAFLRVLVAQSQDRKIKEIMADCAKKVGYARIEAELSPIEKPAPAAAFLAATIKEFGAVSEATQLLAYAHRLCPKNPSYALNYIHILEVENNYQKAFEIIKEFCEKNKEEKVGELTCATIGDIIKPINDINATASLNFVDNPEVERVNQKAEIEPFPIDNNLGPYNNDQLDILAIFFTLVKIFYVTGVLQYISPLCRIIELSRRGRELHLTTVRNEHAYYCEISQLWGYHSLPVPKQPPLYFAGDSHSLAPAWQIINWKKEKRTAFIKLVTGLKCWHIRPSSKFFPKNNFYNVVRTIPKKAEVVFMFGEIDCREGILVSVEKCRYKDHEEGALVSIKIYLDALLELQKEFEWQIYIHPIIPVLNETRPMVKLFTTLLRSQVLQLNNPNLRYLDFFEEFLTPDGSFDKKWELDGTHLSPSYLQILSKASERL